MLLKVGSSSAAITDATGMFRFRTQPGVFKLVISALGYSELQSELLNLGEKENLSVLIYLTSQPVEVLPVYVVAKSRRPLSALAEFEQRMKRNDGFGYFMDLKKINKSPAWSLADILRRIPGANVLRNRVMLRPDCQDAVYVVDGVPVRGIGGQTATDLVEMVVPVTEIAGIEVYRGDARIPGALIPARAKLEDLPDCTRLCH